MQVELISKCSEMDKFKDMNSKLQESLKSQLSISQRLQDEVVKLTA